MRDALRLIGGPRDGGRYEYRGWRVQFPAPLPIYPSPKSFKQLKATEAVRDCDTYRLVTRSFGHRSGYVEDAEAYVHDSISDEEAAKRIDKIMGWAP